MMQLFLSFTQYKELLISIYNVSITLPYNKTLTTVNTFCLFSKLPLQRVPRLDIRFSTSGTLALCGPYISWSDNRIKVVWHPNSYRFVYDKFKGKGNLKLCAQNRGTLADYEKFKILIKWAILFIFYLIRYIKNVYENK